MPTKRRSRRRSISERSPRRLRRAQARAHTPRSGEYRPLKVSHGAARRGVRRRLLGAVGANAFVAASVVVLFVLQPQSFALLAGLVIAASFALVSLGLLLSAQAEEAMHQTAAALGREEPLRALPGAEATDGTL